MGGLNIDMVIAIILFARLGIRLVSGYIKMKKNDDDEINKTHLYALSSMNTLQYR